MTVQLKVHVTLKEHSTLNLPLTRLSLLLWYHTAIIEADPSYTAVKTTRKYNLDIHKASVLI